MDGTKIIVILPAYNEAAHIRHVIESVPRTIKTAGRQFSVSVVVVDDGSKDATAEEAKKTDAVVLRHVMNSGAGAATRTGLRYAEYHMPDLAYAVTIDADGQHAAHDIERLVDFAVVHQADMVVGNRLHTGNKQDMPWFRTVGNRGISFICRVLFGITTEDTQSGLRILSAGAIPAVSRYTIDRYGFCTEMLWHAHRAGIKVLEMPISVTYSKETIANGQSFWGVADILSDLLWLRIGD